MKEARIMKENITYYLVWIICLLAGCAPTPKQIEDTTDPIPMYPDYTDIMIPTNIAPLNFLLRNDADAMQDKLPTYRTRLRGMEQDPIIRAGDQYLRGTGYCRQQRYRRFLHELPYLRK